MEEDTEVTPVGSASCRLKLPLPAPVDSVVELELDDDDILDDLDVETLRRTAPVQDRPQPVPEPPTAIPHWAVIASSALLFAAAATTVALVL